VKAPGGASLRIAIVLWAALELFANTARADPSSAEAEAHIQSGVALRRIGRNAEALSEFQAAYALAPTARAQAQMALALHALGDWLGAERGLEQSLAAAEDPWIAQYRSALEGALATVRAHLARLFVSVNVPTGELLVNGVSVRTVPFLDSVRVVAGTIDVGVRAPGYLILQRTLDVAPGTERHESFVLEPGPAPAPSPSMPTLRSLPFSVVPAPPPPAAASASSAGFRRTTSYVAFGLGGVLGGAGVMVWRVREDEVGIFNDDSRCLVGTRTRGQQCGSYAAAANEALVFEIASFSAAAVAVGVAAWLLGTSRPTAKVAACSPWSTVGLACGGRF
jgi:hypothetical protein